MPGRSRRPSGGWPRGSWLDGPGGSGRDDPRPCDDARWPGETAGPGAMRMRPAMSTPAGSTGRRPAPLARAHRLLPDRFRAHLRLYLVPGGGLTLANLFTGTGWWSFPRSPPPAPRFRGHKLRGHHGGGVPCVSRRTRGSGSGRDARAPRTRRFRESGIRGPAAGRRTILRRFVEDFTGKGLRSAFAPPLLDALFRMHVIPMHVATSHPHGYRLPS